MKRITILIMLLVGFSPVFAQKGKVTSALNYITAGNLEKAKEAIEQAMTHEKSKDWSKTYYAKGRVLQAVAESNDPNTRKLYENPLPEAFKEYQKAIELDEKGKMEKLVTLQYPLLSNDFIKLGIDMFQAGKHKEAMEAFEYSLEIGKKPMFGGAVDTNVVFNAGLAAYKAKIWDKAIAYFGQAKDLEYDDPSLYRLLKESYMESGDTASGVNCLQEGFIKYPSDENVLIDLINYYITSDKNEDAFEYVSLAIEADPDNYSYYFAQGLLFEKMDSIEDAIKSYNKSIELKDDYFNSYYNLGALYFNRGVNLIEIANEIMDNEEYLKAKAKGDAEFAKALPYMEKGLEVNPEDVSTMETLKILYYRMKMMDKHAEMDEKLKNR
ncbi:MAG: tetratricopeptide repeat protein [Bacteroidales bacterium]|nr:tetratricopeptide repeat protein [Bacteroidales bacterium]